MWYMIADSIVLMISFVVLGYSLSMLFGSYTEEIRKNSFSSIVYYDCEFFDKKKNTPQVLSGILREESQKTSAVGGPLLSIPSLLVFSVLGGFTLAMIISQILAPIYILMVFVYVYVVSKSAKFVYLGANSFKSDKVTNIVSNSLSNFKIMTALNLQSVFYVKYAKELDKNMSGTNFHFFQSGLLFSLRYAINFFNAGGILLIGAYFYRESYIEINDLIRIFQILNSSVWILIVVSILVPDITAAVNASKIVSKLLNYHPKIDSRSNTGICPPVSGKIEFSQVSFTYKYRNKSSLQDISFVLAQGESLGIAGKTGSGKSTIALLLLRFYDPSAGFIYLDDQSIENYNITHLRSRIGWVGQEPVVFQGSILDNLRLSRATASREEALEALNEAQATDIVELYGLDTDVGVRGCLLSGGQRQRIAIARALMKQPDVIILDEATSALDNIAEAKIREAIKGRGITVIAIAHRIDYIRACDKIMVIDRGEIAQIGTQKEISEIEGIYKTLIGKSEYN